MSKKKPPKPAQDWCVSMLSPEEQVELFRLAVRTPEEHLETLLEYNRILSPERIVSAQRAADASKPRRPDIDEWIRKQLAADSTLKSPELWERAPETIKEQIGLDRFRKRLTKVRQGR